MALFGKKKGDAPENNQGLNPNSEATKIENGAFDFDSIARDLEAENGPSPFDELLSKPASVDPFDMQPNSLDEQMSGSAFDFPDSSDEDETSNGLPERKVVAASSNDLDNLDDLFGSPAVPNTQSSFDSPDSFPDISLNKAPVVTPATATIVSEQPKATVKKPFPLIPALGALVLLVVIGSAGWHFSQPPEEEPASIAVPARVTINESAPETSGSEKAPATENAPSVAPTASSPTTTVASPEVMTQLKNLWEQGKNAKARGDYASARRFWELALTIKPGHPGFQESIDKLPSSQ